jgi:glyoxylase-like metal-dependent hydrolase (beta-lactamase superfamily II)
LPEFLPGVHIIEVHPPEYGPSGPINICLLVERGKATMVDAGLPGVSKEVVAYLKEIDLSPRAIKRVLVTHHHFDHLGGLPEILELTNAEVWAHRDDAPVIDGTTPRSPLAPESIEARLSRVPAEQRNGAAARIRELTTVPAVAVDLRLVGGEELNVLGGAQILHTPGHTAGHLALFLPALSLLVAGDLLRCQEGVIQESPPAFAADKEQALASARNAVNLGFDSFIGYHREFVFGGARKLLSASLRR